MPNRLDPFDCSLAAAAVRQALARVEHAFVRCTQPIDVEGDGTSNSDGLHGRWVSVGARRLLVFESAGSYSTRLWLSALELANWLHTHADSFADASVIELGAGTGLCSLAIAADGMAATVTATDVSALSLEHVAAAARAQGLVVGCAALDINSSEPLPVTPVLPPVVPPTKALANAPADVLAAEVDAPVVGPLIAGPPATQPLLSRSTLLVASDVLYTPQLADGLALRCIDVVRRGGRAVIADPGRPGRARFQAALEREGMRADFMPLSTPPSDRPILLLHVPGERPVSHFAASETLEG